MANSESKNNGTVFVDFKYRIVPETNKTEWVLALLDSLGVTYRFHGVRINSEPVFQIDRDSADTVYEMIQNEIESRIVVALDDLYDDHLFFAEGLGRMGNGNGKPAESVQSEVKSVAAQIAEKIKEGKSTTEAVEEVTEGQSQSENVAGKAEALGAVNVDDDDEDDEDDTDSFLDDDDEDEDNEEDDEDAEEELVMPDGEEYKFAEQVLTGSDMEFPKVSTPVRMYDILSSNLSLFGYKPTKDDPTKANVFARFKGTTLYRYKGVSIEKAVNPILSEAVKKVKGYANASAGSEFIRAIRKPADEGQIPCSRLNDEGKWMTVVPKTQIPTKSGDKKKKKSK
jgi:hypothetical protein